MRLTCPTAFAWRSYFLSPSGPASPCHFPDTYLLSWPMLPLETFLFFRSHRCPQVLFGTLCPWWIYLHLLDDLLNKKYPGQTGNSAMAGVLSLCSLSLPNMQHCDWPTPKLQKCMLRQSEDLMATAEKWNTSKTKIKYLWDLKKLFFKFYLWQSIQWRLLLTGIFLGLFFCTLTEFYSGLGKISKVILLTWLINIVN